MRRITYLLTLPLVAIAAIPPVRGSVETLTVFRENGSKSETRLRRAVFDLIPATREYQRGEKGKACREGKKCGATQKSNHGGTFSSYRKFIGRHRKSKSQRRSKRKLKKLFMDWLKEEREKVLKEEREKVMKGGSEMH